jgi:hypothetical protein
MSRVVTLQVTVTGPEDAVADDDELRGALEDAVAHGGISHDGAFDVDTVESEDGAECWTVELVESI